MELLTAHSGLDLSGVRPSHTQIAKCLIRYLLPVALHPTVTHTDVLLAYLGLLCQRKSDFDPIEPFRKDRFFAKSLGLKHVPSSPTLRQRLDLAATHSYDWQTILLEKSADLLRALDVPLPPVRVSLPEGETMSWLPLDLDVSTFDNSTTRKEGVPLTYKGGRLYAVFAYLGQEGYPSERQPARRNHACAKEAAAFLYMRKGSCGVFLFTEPLAGRRHVQANERRTKVDWALQIRNY